MSEFELYPAADEEVTRGLRGLYSAPSSPAYWNELEARIMSRVAEVEMEWWNEFDRWVRPALVAAAVLVFAAGAAMLRSDREHTNLAYEAILAPAPVQGAPADVAPRPVLQDDGEKTLRSILTPP
jgi:hypothetical protein